MLAYAVRRLLSFVPLLLGVATITFVLLHVLPGDPVLSMVGERYDAETIARLRAEMRLDDPLYVRYGHYLGNLVRLDLGNSYVTGTPVWDSIRERFPATLRLAVAAMSLSVLFGVTIGVLAAWRRGSALDYLLVGGAVVGVSMPVFWLGVLLIYVFSMRLGILPASGFGNGGLAYLVLPAVTLAMASTAYVARITRSSVLDEINETYVKAARAKGAGEARIMVRHALRNALLPIITVVGVDFGSYLSGAVLTESIFAWPGLGRFTLDAIMKRDLPAIQGSVLFMAILFMIVNLAVDLLYARVDPRVKLGRPAS
ncbi:MAG: ABC transporter permease [Candidatus Krumholzibacteria bacterium]|nr:ABC transporter permease [Candidatus Krumholzibacteria bacterium]MDH4336078.1 ABC transporter permease [Candidatus Krumholzibacteria bacterium]MDH5268346.1 ABC transporter permease [Candidatus Krumholzibacteria bacterium]